MADKRVIFENKKDVIEMFNSIGFNISPESLNALKQKGYIRKNPVEEAEEMRSDFVQVDLLKI